MITTLITGTIGFILTALFFLFPTANLSTIPYIGSSLVTILTTAITTWNAFMVTFPYAETTWNVFLYVLIPFEISLLILKFLVGHRSPEKQI